jgi:hypothetical protein
MEIQIAEAVRQAEGSIALDFDFLAIRHPEVACVNQFVNTSCELDLSGYAKLHQLLGDLERRPDSLKCWPVDSALPRRAALPCSIQS